MLRRDYIKDFIVMIALGMITFL